MTHSVGIKMLKENLSAYVVRASKGERIIVTDRGHEVAELGPIDPERQVIQKLIADGKAEWSGQAFHVDEDPLDVGHDLSSVILEDRR